MWAKQSQRRGGSKVHTFYAVTQRGLFGDKTCVKEATRRAATLGASVTEVFVTLARFVFIRLQAVFLLFPLTPR